MLFLLVIFGFISCGEEDEYGTPIDITLCNGELIAESLRSNERVLAISDIPMEIQNYVATEIPGFALTDVVSYDDQNGNSFFLAGLSNEGLLLFDETINFVCAQGDFTSVDDEYLSFDQLSCTCLNRLMSSFSSPASNTISSVVPFIR